MQVVHGGLFVILPRRAAEAGAPVVGRGLRILTLAPDIIVTVWVGYGFTAFYKPLMFIGGMINYQIHDDTNTAAVCFFQQFVKILHCAEFIHDCLIIADIVAVVIIG